MDKFKAAIKRNDKDLFHRFYPKDGVYQNFVPSTDGMYSIFHFCAEHNADKALREAIEIMIARNKESIDPIANIQDKSLRTPAMVAAMKDHDEVFQVMVNFNVINPAYKDIAGNDLKFYLPEGKKCRRIWNEELASRAKAKKK